MVKEKRTSAPIVSFNRGTPGGGGNGDGSGMEDMLMALILGLFNEFENSMEFFDDDENVKKQICFKLISKDVLSRYSDIPYRMIHDMALVYISVYKGSFGFGSEIMITDKDMEKFGMTEADLYEEAQKNTPEIFKAVVEPLNNMPEFIEEDAQGIEAIYAVTNEILRNGSTSILYDGLLKEIADSNIGKELLIFAGTADFSLVFIVDPICMDGVTQLIKNSLADEKKEHESRRLSEFIYSINTEGKLAVYDKL